MNSPNNPMPWRLEWSEDLSVYIPEIDAEHRHFIELINALNEAIAERMSLSEVRRRMQDVLNDAIAHFEHEEILFKEWGYPEAEQHARMHVAAIKIFHDIMSRIQRSEMDYDWVEAGLHVKELLVSHLLNEDMKYRDYWLASHPESAD
jgi:hemerythrin